ncbi:unnamed protein product [Linum trigynum]|uniref:Uncharacterized protein n=1 Tax=Linum trigynum TaxID=586398 RepID=A0AAV2E568_9ROSI
MGPPQEPLHLGSVMATTFSRIFGRPRVYTKHLGPHHHQTCRVIWDGPHPLHGGPDPDLPDGDTPSYDIGSNRARHRVHQWPPSFCHISTRGEGGTRARASSESSTTTMTLCLSWGFFIIIQSMTIFSHYRLRGTSHYP